MLTVLLIVCQGVRPIAGVVSGTKPGAFVLHCNWTSLPTRETTLSFGGVSAFTVTMESKPRRYGDSTLMAARLIWLATNCGAVEKWENGIRTVPLPFMTCRS